MIYPTDEEILERLPATCPELAAIFFPGYSHGLRRRQAVSSINRRLVSMEKYRMVKFTGVRDKAKIWEMVY